MRITWEACKKTAMQYLMCIKSESQKVRPTHQYSLKLWGGSKEQPNCVWVKQGNGWPSKVLRFTVEQTQVHGSTYKLRTGESVCVLVRATHGSMHRPVTYSLEETTI